MPSPQVVRNFVCESQSQQEKPTSVPLNIDLQASEHSYIPSDRYIRHDANLVHVPVSVYSTSNLCPQILQSGQPDTFVDFLFKVRVP